MWVGGVLRRKEGIGLDDAYLAEVGGVNWVSCVEVDCFAMVSFGSRIVKGTGITFVSSCACAW